MAGEDELFQMELNLHPNEASGLMTIGDEELLGEHGWDLGFWACLDEGEIEDCIAAIGHRRGSPEEEGWEIERLRAEASGASGKTEDAEAITRDEGTGYVYILGSHFGGKDGPLQLKRGFVARFREADVRHITEHPAMELDVSRRSFALHRLINDALEESGPELIPLGKQSHKALIAATIERGEKENKKWAGLVREDDYPINIEGAAFRESGTLLLGLRFPTTAEGRPILIELEGIDRLFDPDGALPEVRGFWTADAIGKGGEMAGVRDLALLEAGEGEELHLVTGNVDSRDKQSVLIQDYPGGRETVATHFRCALPKDTHSGSLEAVMNSIRISLGRRETEIAREPNRLWNPHFYAIFAQVHNTLYGPSSSASFRAYRASRAWPSHRKTGPTTSRTRTKACICALLDSW